MPYPHIQIQALLQPLRRLYQQLLPIFNHLADVIRQPTVGIRHVLVLFQHNDFGRLIQASRACRRRSAPGDPTHNHNFHADSLFVCWLATGSSLERQSLPVFATLKPDPRHITDETYFSI